MANSFEPLARNKSYSRDPDNHFLPCCCSPCYQVYCYAPSNLAVSSPVASLITVQGTIRHIRVECGALGSFVTALPGHCCLEQSEFCPTAKQDQKRSKMSALKGNN